MRYGYWIGIGLGLVLSVGGCKQESAPAQVQALDPGAFATPKAVTRAALATMQNELNARGERKAPEIRAYMAQMLELADTDRIQAAIDASPQYKALTGDDVVSAVVNRWTAMLTHYREQVDFDKSRVTGQTANAAVVLVPAGDATLRFSCSLGSDQKWRISRFEFARPGTQTAAVPASQPAAP